MRAIHQIAVEFFFRHGVAIVAVDLEQNVATLELTVATMVRHEYDLDLAQLMCVEVVVDAETSGWFGFCARVRFRAYRWNLKKE
jgi:hypothetical protein